jgi:hypothetical protein
VILLDPNTAARIAAGVYLVQDTPIANLTIGPSLLGSEGLFDVGNARTFDAQTGIGSYTEISGFGYIAPAIGAMRGEYLIAIRGTNLMPFDGLTDLHATSTRGASGHRIHTGFLTAFESRPRGPAVDIRNYFRGKSPSRIHVVGHSLGGALATLTADMLSTAGVSEVLLYTFGCPRVGDRGFANELRGSIGSGNIYRVYHPADPVPMLPVFPYIHVPPGHAGYAIDPNSNLLVSVGRHSSVNSYVPGTAGTSWSGLRAAGRYVANTSDVERWLVNATLSGSFMGSASLLNQILTVLQWILIRAFQGAAFVIGAGQTLLDRIASLLARGAELAVELAMYTEALVRAIFRFLGRTIATGVRLTTAFLRWVLDLLFTSISNVATQAINLIS